jgi:CRISPR-associated protein Cmr2
MKKEEETKNYLFLLSTSPVQSFISEARKTNDLFAGSQILSELTNEGIKIFTNEKVKGSIIFPNIKTDSKPNRFLGELIGKESELRQIGVDIEKKLRSHFKELGEKSLEKVEIKYEVERSKDKFQGNEKYKKEFEEQFYNQIKNHLEISWLFEEVINDDYKKAYKNIEKNLEAVKNTKIFDAFEETGRKCSIDGRNNALLFGKKKPSLPNKDQRNTSVIIKNSYQLREKEGLSAISFLKRFYNSDTQQNFSSTAEIALMYAEKNLSEEIKNYFEDFKNIFYSKNKFFIVCQKHKVKVDILKEDFESKDWIKRKDNFDYQLLYQDNFDAEDIHPKQKKVAQFILDKLTPHFKDKYYAILAFDGDKMGDMLAGELLQNQETDLKAYQENISKLLSDFATYAKKLLHKDKYNGQAVYAGGDDFLGFINLHYLSDVLTTLREEFDIQVNKELQKKYELTEPFTFSAGIAIAHYKMPLDIVLKTAKDMEHKAKDDEAGKRNAFAIAVLKHSGDRHYTYFKWGEKFQNLKEINEILESLETNFSAKWIQNLDYEFSLFVNKENNYTLQKEHTILVESELKRLLGRSCNLTGTKKQKQVNEICEIAEKLLSDQNGNKYNFKNFIEMLHIVRFIRKELKN